MAHTLEVVLRLTVSEEDFAVNRVEKRVKQARDEAGRQLFVQVLEALDAEALAAQAGAVRQRRVERGLDTTCSGAGG